MKLLRALLIILLFTALGRLAVTYLPIPLPSSLTGMLLLFAVLAFGWLPGEWVQPGSDFTMRHMALLFVPVSVGLIEQKALLMQYGTTLVLSNLVSSILVLVVMAWAVQRGLK
uniref:CidA/LrgA family protein n=1 Tax=Thaumasiovibrio occultus TaxID=1891184 RepID=UPI00131DF975|nr:CidA/LrgA family protein [Thaumasiovibrio occultus]